MDLTPQTLVKIPKPKGFILKILIGILIISLIVIGYLYFSQLRLLQGAYNISQKSDILGNPLFESQSAIISGQIIKVDGKVITLKNTQGIIGQVEISDKIAIFGISDKNLISATSSSNLAQIQTNKDLIINLRVRDGKYEATNISYVVPINVTLPIAPNSTSSSTLLPIQNPSPTNPGKPISLPPAPGIKNY